jgi:hypothetical protein
MIEKLKKDIVKKRDELVSKFNSSRERFNLCRRNFRKREEKIKADLLEASRTWKKVGEKFSWWQSLP